MRNAVFLLDQLNHRRPTPQRKVHLQLFGALVADRSANRLFLFGAQASALTGQADPIMAMGYQLLIGAAPLALLSMLTEDVSLLMWSPEFVLVLVALAGLGSSLAFWLWFEVLERVTLNLANAFTFLVPVFGLMIGAAFFGERLEVIQAAGVVLVLIGIMLVQRRAAASLTVPAETNMALDKPW